MGSGAANIILNLRERAVSGDVNRLQSFLSRASAEVARALIDTESGTDDLDAGGLELQHTGTGSPTQAEVLSGLRVTPEVGSLRLQVSAGLVWMVDPDAVPSADDSEFKIVQDVGIAYGTIAMTGNSAGSTRIDVVECQRQDVVVENPNRDVFDVTSSAFVSTPVPKVVASKLVYRVRVGTAGAGFPGVAGGWLPLAVASVPNATTDNDSITFWDVRPLISDRYFGPGPLSRSLPRRLEGLAVGEFTDPSTFAGIVDVVGPNGRRVGGRMRRGTPGTDGQFIDLTDAANQSTDISGASTGHTVNLILFTPFGLPRWARYTDAAAGPRTPRSPRGIPVLTNVNLLNTGKPASAVTLPASLGFAGATSTDGVAAFGLQWNAGAPDPFFGSEVNGYEVLTPAAHVLIGGAAINLTAGTDFPGNARAIHVHLRVAATGVSTGYLTVEAGLGAPGVTGGPLISKFFGNAGYLVALDAATFDFDFWLNVESLYPAAFAGATYEFTVIPTSSGTFTTGTHEIEVVGWRY